MLKKALKIIFIIILIASALVADRVYSIKNYPREMFLEMNLSYPENVSIMDNLRMYIVDSYMFKLHFNGKPYLGQNIVYYSDKNNKTYIAINKDSHDYITLGISAAPLKCDTSWFKRYLRTCPYEDRSIERTSIAIYQGEEAIIKEKGLLEHTFRFDDKKEDVFRIKSAWSPHWLLPLRKNIFDDELILKWLTQEEFEKLKFEMESETNTNK